jgi:hypothetical protein
MTNGRNTLTRSDHPRCGQRTTEPFLCPNTEGCGAIVLPPNGPHGQCSILERSDRVGQHLRCPLCASLRELFSSVRSKPARRAVNSHSDNSTAAHLDGLLKGGTMNGIPRTSVTGSGEIFSPTNSSAHCVATEPGRLGSASVVPNDRIGIAREEDALATERLAMDVNH